MPPAAYVCHSVPGRLRIRVPDRRRDADYFARIAQALKECPGVQAVTASAATAGVLVTHATDSRTVEAFAREKCLFALGAPAHARYPLVAELSVFARDTDAQLKSATDGYLDMPSVALLGLLGLSAYQLRAGEMMAPGVTLLWYALSLLLMYIPPRPLPASVNGLS